MKQLLLSLLLTGFFSLCAADPVLTIPKTAKPPKIDGQLKPGEWDRAAAVSMFETVGRRHLRLEQPVFYLQWDETYLYLAMESLEGSTNSIIAATTRNDMRSICADDAVEIMLGAGTGREIFDADFATCYIVVNSLGTVWDAKFKPQRNETHNSWQSGIEMESSVNGTRWVWEARIPLKSMSLKPVAPGTKWRINLSRTYASYQYAVLNGAGALNDARIGADLIFGDGGSAVRVLSAGSLPDGLLKNTLELVNNSDKNRVFRVSLNAQSRLDEGSAPLESKSEKTFTVSSGGKEEAPAGGGQKLSWVNQVELTVKDEAGSVLLYLPGNVPIPCARLKKFMATDRPPVDVRAAFLPTLEKLSVAFQAKHWLKQVSLPSADFSAVIRVRDAAGKTVREKSVRFASAHEWETSTADLPEGSYTVESEISLNGKKMQEFSDWFEKKIFEWMKKPVVDPDFLPAPYTPVTVSGSSVSVWGRTYQFGSNGLPVSMVTQGRNYFSGPARLLLNGKEISSPEGFRITESKPVRADGESVMVSDGVKVKVASSTEYDGFVLFRVTCSPVKDTARLESLQLKIPLDDRRIKFYSASGDPTGVSIMGRLIPQGEGRIFDSLTDTRAVATTPSFASLFWVADHDVSFCYAADSDKGWAIRKDSPAVEARREKGTVELTVKLADRPVELKGERTMEFALQTGPTKPLPENWRSFLDGSGKPFTPNVRRQYGADGFTTHGGPDFIHPGVTPELKEKTRQKVAALNPDGRTWPVGYFHWGHVVRGYEETRVFRSEWGLSAYAISNSGRFQGPANWARKDYGDDKNLYYHLAISVCPSYVNFLNWAYDETLKVCDLAGFYDDVGYPFPSFRPELGIGWTDENGEDHYSSGLWLYRERWKQAAAVQAKNNRLNLLSDAQRVIAHYMPAYAFIGVFAPCEKGYYNPFPEKDAYEFFGSLEQFAAMCPARQFGQMAFVGMSSSRTDFPSFHKDGRTMFMLAAMHDQSVGSFGRREETSIVSLEEARALFRPWEKGTEFTGYWASADAVRADRPELKVSYYTRPGCALLLLANTDGAEREFTVTPDLNKLGLDPAKVKFTHAETLQPLECRGSFRLKIPGHDIAMILCGPDGAFRLPEIRNWEGLVGAEGAVREFRGVLPEGNSQFGPFKDGFFLSGDTSSAYAQAETLPALKLPENLSCTAVLTAGSLTLGWENGATLGASVRSDRHGGYFQALAGKKKSGVKCDLNPEREFGYGAFKFNAVRIRLLKDKVEFDLSTDAKTWRTMRSLPRPAECSGAPSVLFVGWGHPGENTFGRNTGKHFKQKIAWPKTVFFRGVTVREEK